MKEKIWAVIAQNESSLVSIQLVIIKLTSIFQFAFFSTVVNGFISKPIDDNKGLEVILVLVMALLAPSRADVYWLDQFDLQSALF